jgi:hypothetical protein
VGNTHWGQVLTQAVEQYKHKYGAKAKRTVCSASSALLPRCYSVPWQGTCCSPPPPRQPRCPLPFAWPPSAGSRSQAAPGTSGPQHPPRGPFPDRYVLASQSWLAWSRHRGNRRHGRGPGRLGGCPFCSLPPETARKQTDKHNKNSERTPKYDSSSLDMSNAHDSQTTQ